MKPEEIKDFINKLSQTHGDSFHWFAWCLYADEQTAWDIVQEAFTVLHQRLIDDFEFSTGPVPYLRGIILRMALSARRSRTRLKRLGGIGGGTPNADGSSDKLEEPCSTEPPPLDSLLNAERDESEVRQRELIRPALELLDPIDREIVQLHFFEGRSTSELAERLGIPQRTVQDRLKRAKKQLRDILVEGLHPRQHDAPDEFAEATLLGEFAGRPVRKHPPPGTGTQPFLTWDDHKNHRVCFTRAEWEAMTLEAAVALLRQRGKLP